jgi:esterase/lipase
MPLIRTPVTKRIRPILESRHQPSGLNSPFKGDRLNFSDYVASTQNMLLAAHSDRMTLDKERIVAGNAPFELKPEREYPSGVEKPYRRGVLLIHGLTDSPYFMRHLASFFQQNGFRVMAILLPGHGTQAGDLLDVRWQEWVRAVAYGVAQLDIEVEEIHLAGLSTGAALAIYHSLLDTRIRSLLLFSPALRITPLAALANLHKIYSWLLPSAKWIDIMPDVDIYKYESFPKNAVAQTYAMIKNLHAMLHKHELNLPVFIAASADDTTVDSSATLDFMAHSLHPCSRLVYYSTDPKQSPPGIPENKVILRSSVVPEQNIISFSHLSIVLPPEDAHYGIKGNYSNCLHYYPVDRAEYAVCMANFPAVRQGEVTESNLRTGTMRRLMYNPHFADMEVSMQHFIESLP